MENYLIKEYQFFIMVYILCNLNENMFYCCILPQLKFEHDSVEVGHPRKCRSHNFKGFFQVCTPAMLSWGWQRSSRVSGLVTLLVLVIFMFGRHFSFCAISVLMIFWFWEISVLVTCQFWWHFRFGYISVLAIFNFFLFSFLFLTFD